MAFPQFLEMQIDHLVGAFCRNRVSERARHQLKYGYRIEGQNVFLYESRPRWDKPSEWLDLDFVKLRYIKSRNIWKLYWKRASGKWESYEPNAESRNLAQLVAAIDADRYGCFFG